MEKIVLKMRTNISDAFEGAIVTREGKERRFLSSITNNLKLHEENQVF